MNQESKSYLFMSQIQILSPVLFLFKVKLGNTTWRLFWSGPLCCHADAAESYPMGVRVSRELQPLLPSPAPWRKAARTKVAVLHSSRKCHGAKTPETVFPIISIISMSNIAKDVLNVNSLETRCL